MSERRGFSVALFSAATMILTACSGGTSPVANGLSTTALTRARTDLPPQLLYVSDKKAKVVNVFEGAAPYAPVRTITSGLIQPFGLSLDGRKLLIANFDDVVEYDSGATSPSFTYSEGLRYPIDVLADGEGQIYVADKSKKAIFVFPRGKNKAKETISMTSSPYALAIGGQGNIYVATVGTSGSAVFEIPRGSSTPQNLDLKFGSQYASVIEGIAVDDAGNIVVADNMPGVSRAQIEIFAAGTHNVATTYRVSYEMGNLALDHAQNHLFVAALHPIKDAGPTQLYAFNYDSEKLTLKDDGTVANACSKECWGVVTGP
jgi:ribosomal protein L30E